jgi:hypothetical protein
MSRSPWRGGPLAERIAGQVAWWLPRKVVYFAVIRAWAHATDGQYGSTVVPEVTADVVLRRWGRQP